jgi:uncharacterized protein YndB with AHSA1/START domain
VTSGEFTVTIDAKREVVWPWVADLSKHADWSPKPYRIEWLEGEPNAVGSRFHSVGEIPGDKHHENEGHVTENQPHTRFTFRSSDPQGEYAHTYDLTPNGDGTDVTHRIEFVKMHGIAAVLLPPIFALSGKPQSRRRMEVLKQKVEGSA